MAGRNCDDCGYKLTDEDFDNYKSWSYVCPNCDFIYVHGSTKI